MDGMAGSIALYRRTLAELYGGDPKVITTGKIPESHIVFLDEIFSAPVTAI